MLIDRNGLLTLDSERAEKSEIFRFQWIIVRAIG